MFKLSIRKEAAVCDHQVHIVSSNDMEMIKFVREVAIRDQPECITRYRSWAKLTKGAFIIESVGLDLDERGCKYIAQNGLDV